MDPQRFDDFARALAPGLSRRQVFRGLAAGAAGAVLVLLDASGVAARRCKPVGHRCGANAQCCSGLCETTSHTCVGECNQGSGVCGDLAACAPGCSCYFRSFGSVGGFACLEDPDPADPTCSQLEFCFGPEDCPSGFLCVASSCCPQDSVCLRICSPGGAR